MHGRRLTAFDKHVLIDREGEGLWMVDWRAYGLSRCSLYIVAPENGWPCKIGISVSPRKRLNGLQTASWKRLKVARCFWLHTVKEARGLERAVHEILTEENKWLHGEWFDMKPDKAAEMVEFKASVMGLECNHQIDRDDILRDIKQAVEDAKFYGDGFKKNEQIENDLGFGFRETWN